MSKDLIDQFTKEELFKEAASLVKDVFILMKTITNAINQIEYDKRFDDRDKKAINVVNIGVLLELNKIIQKSKLSYLCVNEEGKKYLGELRSSFNELDTFIKKQSK